MKVKRRVLKEAAASLLAVFLLLSLGLGSAFAQSETGQLTVKQPIPVEPRLPAQPSQSNLSAQEPSARLRPMKRAWLLLPTFNREFMKSR